MRDDTEVDPLDARVSIGTSQCRNDLCAEPRHVLMFSDRRRRACEEPPVVFLSPNFKGTCQPINLAFRCGLDQRLSISSFVVYLLSDIRHLPPQMPTLSVASAYSRASSRLSSISIRLAARLHLP